jgi:hypothetical protein
MQLDTVRSAGLCQNAGTTPRSIAQTSQIVDSRGVVRTSVAVGAQASVAKAMEDTLARVGRRRAKSGAHPYRIIRVYLRLFAVSICGRKT